MKLLLITQSQRQKTNRIHCAAVSLARSVNILRRKLNTTRITSQTVAYDVTAVGPFIRGGGGVLLAVAATTYTLCSA